MSGTALNFDRGVSEVEGMMERGTAFARVEDAIDHAGLSQDQKAALWLVAWSLRDPALRHRHAGGFGRDAPLGD